jgi:hypothetical protein
LQGRDLISEDGQTGAEVVTSGLSFSDVQPDGEHRQTIEDHRWALRGWCRRLVLFHGSDHCRVDRLDESMARCVVRVDRSLGGGDRRVAGLDAAGRVLAPPLLEVVVMEVEQQAEHAIGPGGVALAKGTLEQGDDVGGGRNFRWRRQRRHRPWR